MSAGKGFGTSPMGFNKQEVNEYIASLSKRMSEIESEKKELEKKYESVKKIVDGADERVKLAESSAKERVEQLEEQIRSERKNSEELIDQIDELKRKLKNAGSNAGGASGKNIAAAEKQAEEIIASAKKTARETVANANKTAEEIIAKAKNSASSGASRPSVDLSGFLAQLKDFTDSVNSGCKALLNKAEEISASENSYADETADFSAFEEPSGFDTETSGSDFDFESNSDNSMDDLNSLIDSMSADSSSDDMNSGFGEDLNGNIADDMTGGFEDMTGNFGEDMNSNFGEDMSGGFGEEDMSGSMNMDFGFGSMDDMNETDNNASSDLDADMMMSDNSSENSDNNSFDLSFGNDDMFSGFDLSDNNASDDEMSGDLTADFSDTVEAGDAGLKDDFNLGGDNGMDEMQKLLEQAELTFGGGSSEFEEKTSGAAEDDWSSLQNELNALEMQNDSGSSDQQDSIDDNSGNDIWSLGNLDMSENDDDDMSSDLFGSF